MLEKMVRVQRESARKSEKLDFLEEHVQALVSELKKKNRIVQFYLVKEDSGMMASEASDKHKVCVIQLSLYRIFNQCCLMEY